MGLRQSARLVKKFSNPAEFVKNKNELEEALLYIVSEVEEKEEQKKAVEELMKNVVMVMLSDNLKAINKERG